MENTKKTIKPWQDWRLYVSMIGIAIVSELIGPISIPIGSASISLLPLVYALILALVLYLIKPFKFMGHEQSVHADAFMGMGVTILIAKMSVVSGSQIMEVITASPALILQNLGNLGTIFFALPVALLLGFKREAIGMTHSIGREPNIALVTEKYGSDSPEFRGVMVVYIVGTVFGAIFLGLIAGVMASVTPISIEAYAMATGCGSAGMMSAAIAQLVAMAPAKEALLTSYASISNLISTVAGLYISIFIGLPLTEKLYSVLEPKIGRPRKKKELESK